MYSPAQHTRVYGYHAESFDPELADAPSAQADAEACFRTWASETDHDATSPVTWFTDTNDVRFMPLLDRPGGSRLAEQLEPGDILLLANHFPYATPYNILDVFSFIANHRITAIHTPSQTVLEPDAVSQFLPALEAIIDHVAPQFDAMIEPPE